MSRKMKDSGVEWIGEIPEDWVVVKLSNLIECYDWKRVPISAELRKSGIYPYWGAGSITDYVDDYLFDEELVLLGEDGAPFFDKIRDVAFLVNGKIWVNNHIHVLKARQMLSSQYLAHHLNITDYGCYINGSILNKLTQSNMRKIAISLPSKDEQMKIISFLDSIVSPIDSIIERTKETINDYKSLKQSIITEAVTKGLNKDLEMKDSRVEWIGEVPNNWEIKKLKYLFKIKKDIAGKEGYDILSVTQSGLKVKDISSNEGQIAADYSKYQFVQKGDFVMNHMDLLTGWVDYSQFDGVTSPDYRVFQMYRPDNHSPQYYNYIFQSCYKNKIFYGMGQGVSNLGRWRLQTEKFINFELPVPDKVKQLEIVSYLNNKCKAIDSLIIQKQKLIEDMESYKKSLIYECVTGKREII